MARDEDHLQVDRLLLLFEAPPRALEETLHSSWGLELLPRPIKVQGGRRAAIQDEDVELIAALLRATQGELAPGGERRVDLGDEPGDRSLTLRSGRELAPDEVF
ncbi:MAG: hypothetical protein D6701_07470 [Gemmatimonadetes bacterium]|nr:MAG: hypothetical protein D6701_07470 [Gemmatimonadota bacterium]